MHRVDVVDRVISDPPPRTALVVYAFSGSLNGVDKSALSNRNSRCLRGLCGARRCRCESFEASTHYDATTYASPSITKRHVGCSKGRSRQPDSRVERWVASKFTIVVKSHCSDHEFVVRAAVENSRRGLSSKYVFGDASQNGVSSVLNSQDVLNRNVITLHRRTGGNLEDGFLAASPPGLTLKFRGA